MNRLASQKSPYLLQHADNPVDWHPWGEEAFETARREDKPVFLSIGYSTCHWCHVMEKESFADPAVARVMNGVFVCIKVDREERPDLDEHFMTVSRLLTGTGGWPLTVLLTPKGEAFYAATYIPRETAYGRTGMLELVPRIQEIWKTRRDEVTRSAEAITAELDRISTVSAQGFRPGPDTAAAAARALSAEFDDQFGGFGGAPKFPMPTVFGLLLRAWKRGGGPAVLDMTERTLTAMRAGGIYDQVGFGFHRYSTDVRWHVPHFEKMLYDQALHVLAYTDAWQATGREAWKRTAQEVCAYVRRDLSAPDGGFATAEDADSEGAEGRFYLWTEQEIAAVLGPRSNAFLERFELAEGHLHRREMDLDPPGQDEAALLEARSRRPRPLRDDKVLADWNGLMIAAMARAGGAFVDDSLLAPARAAADFVLHRMRTPDGRLLHRYRGGEPAIDGFADDYAFLAWGLLELYEATFEGPWLEECVRLVEGLLARFWDEAGAGLFSTTASSEMARRKSYTDGVIPSANSVAALLLLKLNRLTGQLDYQRKAERIIALYPSTAAAEALSFSFLLSAADFAAGPTSEIVIAGDPSAPDTARMRDALRGSYQPNAVILRSDARLHPFTASLRPVDGRATAYVCRDFTCSLPTTDAEVMLRLLQTPSGDTARP